MMEFYPFRGVDYDKLDIDFDNIAEDLDLMRSQRVLLQQLLDVVEITFWFTDGADNDDGLPSLGVNCFWDGCMISHADLIDMLASAFKSRNEIGDEKEIAALNRLKTLIDAAIAEREKTPS